MTRKCHVPFCRAVEKVTSSLTLINSCGHVHKILKLEDRRWRCPECHTEQDRDTGAAVNILREGASSHELGNVSQGFGFAIAV